MSTEQTANSSMTPPHLKALDISAFPPEILVKIVFHLDVYSINNLVDAFPSIAPHFLLMTPGPPTIFTSEWFSAYIEEPKKEEVCYNYISDDEWASLAFNDTYDAEQIKTSQEEQKGPINWGLKQYIKLYELTSGSFAGDFIMSTIDSLSIVYVSLMESCGYNHLPSFVYELITEHPSATFEIGGGFHQNSLSWDEYHPNEEVYYKHDCFLLTSITVDIETFAHQAIKELTLVLCSNGSGEPITLKNLRLPSLRYLTIIYYDVFPKLESVWPGHRDRNSGNCLRFIHAPSMRAHLEGPLPFEEPIFDNNTRYTLGDLTALDSPPLTSRGEEIWPLIHYFSDIRIIGGPVSLGELLTSSRCRPPSTTPTTPCRLRSIHWKQTSHCPGSQRKISLSSAFEHVGAHWNDKCLVEVSYECSFINPVPFVSDIVRADPESPDRATEYAISLVYHTGVVPLGIDRPACVGDINAYLDGFMERNTANQVLVHLRWKPTEEQVLAGLVPRLKATRRFLRRFPYRFTDWIYLNLVGCPILRDSAGDVLYTVFEILDKRRLTCILDQELWRKITDSATLKGVYWIE